MTPFVVYSQATPQGSTDGMPWELHFHFDVAHGRLVFAVR